LDEKVKLPVTIRLDKDPVYITPIKKLRVYAKRAKAETLEKQIHELQIRAIWLAWKIIYDHDLCNADEEAQIQNARRLASQTVSAAFRAPSRKKDDSPITPVTVEFGRKKK
jgi:hypothetical protein